MKYNCETCKYSSDIFANYKAHLATKKHMKLNENKEIKKETTQEIKQEAKQEKKDIIPQNNNQKNMMNEREILEEQKKALEEKLKNLEKLNVFYAEQLKMTNQIALANMYNVNRLIQSNKMAFDQFEEEMSNKMSPQLSPPMSSPFSSSSYSMMNNTYMPKTTDFRNYMPKFNENKDK
jgi:CHAT domain-containing protein